MATLTYKLETLAAKVKAGKPAIVKITGIPYQFLAVVWGGTSPRVCLRAPDGATQWATAAEWKRIGAALP